MPVLTYFDARGRAEPVRLCYALKGVAWTESRPENMHTDKETYPYGQVPRLVDGSVAVLQSLAILRHVGRTHGLYGKSDADAARIDSLLDGLEDLRNKTKALVCESPCALYSTLQPASPVSVIDDALCGLNQMVRSYRTTASGTTSKLCSRLRRCRWPARAARSWRSSRSSLPSSTGATTASPGFRSRTSPSLTWSTATCPSFQFI